MTPGERAKCVIDEVIKLKPEIFRLIDAIESKREDLIIASLLSLLGHSGDIYLKCFADVLERLNIDWPKFGKCIIQTYVKQIPGVVIPLIQAIKSKNWAKVASIALKLVAQGIPGVIKCYKSS